MNLRRRNLIALGSAILLAPRIVAAQQPTRIPRVAYLSLGSLAANGVFFDLFKKRLIDLGYIEGQSIVFDTRWAEGRFDRLPSLAAELVALKPDVIIASGASGTAIRGRRSRAGALIAIRAAPR